MKSYDLPTIAECRAFLDAINAGRAVYGAELLDVLEYDVCEPGSPVNCLSAFHLAQLGGGRAGSTHFRMMAQADELADALGTHRQVDNFVKISPAISRVTDLFDESVDDPDLWHALRDRLEEADVVAPRS